MRIRTRVLALTAATAACIPALVYSHFGEGRHGETEEKIQALMSEPASADTAPAATISKGS